VLLVSWGAALRQSRAATPPLAQGMPRVSAARRRVIFSSTFKLSSSGARVGSGSVLVPFDLLDQIDNSTP
jgi:hypothetical protein